MNVYENGERKFNVRFRKEHCIKSCEGRKNRDCINTLCQISLVVGPKQYSDIAVGVASQHPRDNYDKHLGKHIALRRALYASGLHAEDNEIILEQFEKEFSC